MREKLTKRVSYNDITPGLYTGMPEFTKPLPTNAIFVKQGVFKLARFFELLVSEGFAACSGALFRSSDLTAFGLWHVLPEQEPSDRDIKKLKLFTGGQMILVEGLCSIHQPLFLTDLQGRFNIQHINTITIPTIEPGSGDVRFHLAFRPTANEILVARNSHKDLLPYVGFKHNAAA